MNKLVFILLLFSFNSVSQGLFDKSYSQQSLSAFNAPSDFTSTSDNGYVLIANDLNQIDRLSIIRTDSLGIPIWSQFVNGQYINGDAIEVGTNYYVVSTKIDTNFNNSIWYSTPIMFKYDNTGNLIWSKAFGPNLSYDFVSQILEIDGSLYLIGYSGSDTTTTNNACNVSKTDLDGNIIWQKTFDGATDIEVRGAVITAEKDILIGGIGWSIGASSILKIDTTGALLWSKTYTEPINGDLELLNINIATNGDIITTGRGYLNGTTWDIFSMRLNSQGNFLWGKSYVENTSDDEGYTIHELSSGELVICAEPESFNITSTSSQTALLKLDSLGNLIQMKIIRPDDMSFPFSSILHDDGSLSIYGINGAWGNSNYSDLYLIRTNQNLETDCKQQEVFLVQANFTVLVGILSSESTFGAIQNLSIVSNPLSLGYFNICSDLGLDVPITNENKKIVRIVDVTGRESKDELNTVLIYIFDDGSTEKVFRME